MYNNRLYQGDQLSALLMGVELEQKGDQMCTYEQHDSLAQVVVREGLDRGWRWPYYLVGHYEVARPFGRRVDPLGFLWGDFVGRLLYYARLAEVAGLN